MHAHNELVVLNRLLMFSMNRTSEGDFHDSAQAVQMWCLLQILAAKLYETWKMLDERFLKASPEDEALRSLTSEHKESLQWLKEYFGTAPSLKTNSLSLIRDKTAFHYDKLNLADALDNLAERENTVFLAQHPANTLYYLGSAIILRTLFGKIAHNAGTAVDGPHTDRINEGFRIVIEDAKFANYQMSLVLYGLIERLLEGALGCELSSLDQVWHHIRDVPAPEAVGLPHVIDMDSRSTDEN